jgi:hypothetical protein
MSFGYAQDGEPFDLELMAVSLPNGWSNHFEFRYSDFEFVDLALPLNRQSLLSTHPALPDALWYSY